MDAIIIFFASKLHIGIVLVGVLFCALLSNKRKVFFAYKALIALPVAFVLGRFASLVISSPRPFVVENIQPLIAHIPNNGFPSEHTLLVATISALVYTESKVVGVILGVLAISVGIARVLANVHHSVDVVGSVGIAIFAVVISFYLVRLLQTLSVRRIPNSFKK